MFIFHHFKWDYGDWSECNKSCGGGHRIRNVECKALIQPTLFHFVTTLSMCVFMTLSVENIYIKWAIALMGTAVMIYYSRYLLINGQKTFDYKMNKDTMCKLNPSSQMFPLKEKECNVLPCISADEVYGKYIGNVNSLSGTGEDYMDVMRGIGWTQLDCANLCEQRDNCFVYGFINEDENGKPVGICHLYNRPYNPDMEVKVSHLNKWQNYFIGYKNENRLKSKIKDGNLPAMEFINDSDGGEVVMNIDEEFGLLNDTIYPSFEAPNEYHCAKQCWEDTRTYGYQYDTDHHICQLFNRDFYYKVNKDGRGSVYSNIKVVIKSEGGLYSPPREEIATSS